MPHWLKKREGVFFYYLATLCRLRIAGAVFCALAATGCATYPTQEMSNARQAVRAAQDAGAQKHAAQLLEQAESRLKEAEGSVAAESGYKVGREAALAARETAIRARTVAIAIAAAKTAVAEAAALGVLTDSHQDVLQRAVAAAAKGDDSTAVKLAEQVEQEANQAVSATHKQ